MNQESEEERRIKKADGRREKGRRWKREKERRGKEKKGEERREESKGEGKRGEDKSWHLLDVQCMPIINLSTEHVFITSSLLRVIALLSLFYC